MSKNYLGELLDWIYHLCVALFPVLYIFAVPKLGISLGTIILLGLVPYSVYYIIKGWDKPCRLNATVFLLFFGYLTLRMDGNITRIVFNTATFVVIYGQVKGAIKAKKIRKIIEIYTIINIALIVIQLVSYFVYDYQIIFLPKDLVYKEYQGALVIFDNNTYYRPSGLFLEPAHFAEYALFALISSLFPLDGRIKLKKAITIGLGCILSASSMGVVLTIGIVGWFIIFDKKTINNRFSRFVKLIPIILIGVAVFANVDYLWISVEKIFTSKSAGYNAMEGRTRNWDDAMETLKGIRIWIGHGDSHDYPRYLVGVADSIYKYGVVGVALEALCLFYLMIKKVDNYVWCCCAVFITMLFFAHLTNYASIIFYFGLIIADAIIPKEKNGFC